MRNCSYCLWTHVPWSNVCNTKTHSEILFPRAMPRLMSMRSMYGSTLSRMLKQRRSTLWPIALVEWWLLTWSVYSTLDYMKNSSSDVFYQMATKFDDFKKRVKKIAFTDSVHTLHSQSVSKKARKWIIEVCWLKFMCIQIFCLDTLACSELGDQQRTSQQAVGISFWRRQQTLCWYLIVVDVWSCNNLSFPSCNAGTQRHVETSWFSFEHIFAYFSETWLFSIDISNLSKHHNLVTAVSALIANHGLIYLTNLNHCHFLGWLICFIFDGEWDFSTFGNGFWWANLTASVGWSRWC